VRRKTSIAFLLLAWLCANGSLWEVVQVVAWGKMFARYTQEFSVGDALARTFDASKPCALCKVAQKGHNAASANEQTPASTGATDKVLLAFHTTAPLVIVAPDFSWPGVTDDSSLTRTEAVPVPPPRV
jgi:hypothetical protein